MPPNSQSIECSFLYLSESCRPSGRWMKRAKSRQTLVSFQMFLLIYVSSWWAHLIDRVCVSMWVCECVRERHTHRNTEKKRKKEKERDREIEKEKEKEGIQHSSALCDPVQRATGNKRLAAPEENRQCFTCALWSRPCLFFLHSYLLSELLSWYFLSNFGSQCWLSCSSTSL